MAKLSARGRTELARVVKDYEVPEDGTVDPVVRRRRTVALMSDGRLLVKDQAWWKQGMAHDWGWKLRQKTSMSPVEFVAHLGAKGYVEARGR